MIDYIKKEISILENIYEEHTDMYYDEDAETSKDVEIKIKDIAKEFEAYKKKMIEADRKYAKHYSELKSLDQLFIAI